MLYNLFENRDFVSVFAVALLAEGVDRNSIYKAVQTKLGQKSPSSRRAWIEIDHLKSPLQRRAVALLAEGVDRNTYIRICLTQSRVALLAEGVDRNLKSSE